MVASYLPCLLWFWGRATLSFSSYSKMASEMIFASKPSCGSPNIGDSSKHVCSWGVIILSTECIILAICAWQISVHLNSDINDVLLRTHKSREDLLLRTSPCRCPLEQIPSEGVDPNCCRKDVPEILQKVSREFVLSDFFSSFLPHSFPPSLPTLPISIPSPPWYYFLQCFFFFCLQPFTDQQIISSDTHLYLFIVCITNIESSFVWFIRKLHVCISYETLKGLRNQI